MEKKNKKPSRESKSTLYIAQHKGLSEYYKIGCTNDLDKRIQTLDTGSPTGITILFHIKNKYAYLIEQTVLKHFNNYQSNLEWFKMSKEEYKKMQEYILMLIEQCKDYDQRKEQ